MPQHDYVIDNQGSAAARADLNNLFQAIASQNSGDTAPATTIANMFWYETDTNTLWKRNEANSAWISIGVFDEAAGTFTPSGGAAIATQAEAEAGSNNTKMMTPLRSAQAIAALGLEINYQAFTASGTWTKPSGISANAIVYFEMIGGGGGGGARARGSASSSGGATGGGGGGFVAKTILASALGATVSVGVGGGGAGGVTPSSNNTTDGAAGGASSFGSFSVAGGSGGTGAMTPPTGNSNFHGFDGFIGGDPTWTASLGTFPRESIHGGGAGGGSAAPNGTSLFAGNGGAGLSSTASGSIGPATAGSAPGGGGGGTLNSSTSGAARATGGAGARGEVRVWTIG